MDNKEIYHSETINAINSYTEMFVIHGSEISETLFAYLKGENANRSLRLQKCFSSNLTNTFILPIK